MGLISWLMERIGWKSARPAPHQPNHSTSKSLDGMPSHGRPEENGKPLETSVDRPPRRIRLFPTRRRTQRSSTRRESPPYIEVAGSPPYRYARYGSQTGHYLDLSRDGDEAKLWRFGLPVFHTPEQLAKWIGLPLNKIAWLVHRFSGGRPAHVTEAHYHFHWVKKRRGGWRLIEAPKRMLKLVQTKILQDLLNQVPVHSNAHGFTVGRSIVTNARPHVGQEVLLKFDLANFYTSVTFARVVAVFRGLGYSREAAIWLGLLTTSAVPGNLGFQDQGPYVILSYLRRHLPQGAPTSPAIANLSAFGLDVRLSGLANSYNAKYTRYADDLTFSGPAEFSHGFRTLIPLVEQIIKQERFALNAAKRQVLRSHQRLTVTGVVVNEKPNIARSEYDRLKAILTNCLRFGPSTQNRDQVEDFYSHLRGRIAYVSMLNAARGQTLGEVFARIDWTK